MTKRLMAMALGLVVGGLGWSARADNAAQPAAEPVLEAPTLRSLGAYWVIRGDDNQNAGVTFEYRKPGSTNWRQGPPLFRVEKGRHKDDKGRTDVDVPADAWLFAGSLLLLDPDTAYELRLTLADPDGGPAVKTLAARTIAQPVAPKDAPQRHVVPGDGASGGGDGSAGNPFQGLAAAQRAAKPGDTFLLHKGVYQRPFVVRKSGEPGNPIIWRSAGDGEAIIDGKFAKDDKLEIPGHAIDAIGVHDVWFEGLTICNAHSAVRAHESSRIVVRRCHIRDCVVGIFAKQNETGNLTGFFISDNLMEGFMPWPVTEKQWAELPESRAVWISGTGHVVCYNRMHHFKDGPDTDSSRQCTAIDFHNNDISEMFDDGAEMDGSHRNTRCFLNRMTNMLTAVSLQPVYGGPVYVFRNVAYNFRTEALKLHNRPSGGVIVHNTFVKKGSALTLSTSAQPSNLYSRNNLFIGTEGRAMDYTPQMVNCDYDYDGFGGFSGDVFLKLNGRWKTPEETRAKAGIYKHLVVVDPARLFANGAAAPGGSRQVYDAGKIDLRLNPTGQAIDAGQVLTGFNDGFSGKGPDLGAYELGEELPYYGIRPAPR